MTRTILATGGAGYIGSHICYELLMAGYQVVVLDDFSNSSAEAIKRVSRLSNATPILVKGDVRDPAMLDRIFSENSIDAVIHLAGVKAVGESVQNPQKYYDINVAGSLNLFGAMQRHGVSNVVFSSSATVYGDPEKPALIEGMPTNPVNPYGQTKLMVENILQDITAANPDWRSLMLRYFNPVGAHTSGQIGEDPNGIPNNLFPLIGMVASKKRPMLKVFGADYDTPDGTCIRDYIHVVDLARGHLKAVEYLLSDRQSDSRTEIVNLGTDQGSSVFQVIKAWEAACGFEIPHQITDRRDGDVPAYYADSRRAKTLFGWQAEYDLVQMCADHWHWQSNNPDGYGK